MRSKTSITGSLHPIFYGWAAAKRLFLIMAILTFWSQPSWAESPPPAVPISEDVFEAPCLALGLPKPVVMAIAKMESNFQPWALNIEGRSFRFASKEAALSKAEEARAAGRSFDLGLMQVNNWWLRKYDIPLKTALDPPANIYIGGWILKQELDRHGGNIRAAVGAYHSPNPARAAGYAKLVFNTVQDRSLNKAAPRPPVSNQSRSPMEGRRTAPHPAATLLVTSKHKTPAQGQSLKASPTAAVGSMKVNL